MYKNIIFDVGEVLFGYQWIGALEQAGPSHEVAKVLGPQLFDDPLWKELDLGVRPYFEVVEEMASKHPEYHDAVVEFLTRVERMPLSRPKVWEEVHRLKEKGYKIFVLSNYSEYMFGIHTKNRPFLADLDGAMVSYMIHVNKPDARIYQALLEKYGLNPEECLFFDDRPENTAGAIACGIDAITVTGEDFLIGQLRKL